jgi:hypothetical protein
MTARFVALVLASALLAAAGASAEPKREVPDYDGRGNPDAVAEHWWIWIPRVVTFPFYVVGEYVIRRPAARLVEHAERERWADTIEQLFTFGPQNKSALYPTALFDFGLLPSVGLYLSSEDVLAPHNTLRVHVATWGKPWIVATVADRYMLDRTDSFQVRGDFRRSEDNLFFGIGPDVTSATQSRYGLERIEGNASYHHRLFGESRLEARAGVHRIQFVDGTCCGDPELIQRVDDGSLTLPPGYGQTYTAAFGSLDLMLDTRAPRPAPGSGAFFHAWATPNIDLTTGHVWAQYGATVGGGVDLDGHQRTLKVQLATAFVDSISQGTIPFTEYVGLDSDLMAGFVPGWMIGQSTAAAQLEYSWPVWIGVDAQTRVGIGNAFGNHLEGVVPSNYRWSWDIGLSTTAKRDQGLELLFGLGSETFEQGAGITSVRIAVGSRQGF